jgi:hypothetical protein
MIHRPTESPKTQRRFRPCIASNIQSVENQPNEALSIRLYFTFPYFRCPDHLVFTHPLVSPLPPRVGFQGLLVSEFVG